MHALLPSHPQPCADAFGPTTTAERQHGKDDPIKTLRWCVAGVRHTGDSCASTPSPQRLDRTTLHAGWRLTAPALPASTCRPNASQPAAAAQPVCIATGQVWLCCNQCFARKTAILRVRNHAGRAEDTPSHAVHAGHKQCVDALCAPGCRCWVHLHQTPQKACRQCSASTHITATHPTQCLGGAWPHHHGQACSPSCPDFTHSAASRPVLPCCHPKASMNPIHST